MTEDWEDRIDDSRFISFMKRDNRTTIVTFLDNGVFGTNSFGNNCVLFQVNENGKQMTLSASRTLAHALKQNMPVLNKTFKIQQTGSGYDTEYIVTPTAQQQPLPAPTPPQDPPNTLGAINVNCPSPKCNFSGTPQDVTEHYANMVKAGDISHTT